MCFFLLDLCFFLSLFIKFDLIINIVNLWDEFYWIICVPVTLGRPALNQHDIMYIRWIFFATIWRDESRQMQSNRLNRCVPFNLAKYIDVILPTHPAHEREKTLQLKQAKEQEWKSPLKQHKWVRSRSRLRIQAANKIFMHTAYAYGGCEIPETKC